MNKNIKWWPNFFEGLIVESQKKMNNPNQTKIEAEYILKTLNLKKESVIADVPCGDGRLSIELAKDNYKLKGIDISKQIIQFARESALKLAVEVDFNEGDMLKLPWESELDGAFCFGNSFAYFDDIGNKKFLENVFHSLKTGGKFLLQSNLIAESILARPMNRSWYQFDEILFLHSPRYDPRTSILTSEYKIVAADMSEDKTAFYRIYQLRELIEIMTLIGFKNLKIYGGLNHEPYKLGDASVYILAEKL